MLCLSLALMGQLWNKDGSLKSKVYIPFQFALSTSGVLNFFCYFLLLNTMVPVSLFVTIEFLKLLEASYVSWDIQMYDKERDIQA